MTCTLTDEHALLLDEVTVRAGDVMTLAAQGLWPQRALQRLLGYLRVEVMQQMVDEEGLLFPDQPAPAALARLRRDHLQLRYFTEALADAASGGSCWTSAQVGAASRDLLAVLERHIAAEDELLATAYTPEAVPAATVLTGRSHEWYPVTEGAVIDLDVLPAGRMVDATVERLLRLRADEQVELRSSADLREVWRRLDRLHPGDYSFAYLQEGPEQWAVQVCRRPAG